METKNDLDNVEHMLNEIRNSYRRTSAAWLMITVVLIIFTIYFVSFSVKHQVHQAVEEQNISGQIEAAVERGFEQAISNFEIDE